MTVNGLVIVVLYIMAGLLIILFIFVLSRYMRDRLKEDLRTSAVLLVIAMVLLGLNMGVVRYDSIRYFAQVDPDGGARVILPIPNEQELIDRAIASAGSGSAKIVKTDKGRGLELTFSSPVMIDVEVFSRSRSFDHSTDLMDEECFFIFVDTEDPEHHVWFPEFRIIHEETFDLHSNQFFHHRGNKEADPFDPGWNSFEYEYVT